MFMIAWIVIGMLSGLAVNKLTERTRTALVADIVADVVLGSFGAVIGGFVFYLARARGVGDLPIWSLPSAALGALLLLAAFKALRRTGLGFL